jgi:pre-mRNA-processing factor 6
LVVFFTDFVAAIQECPTSGLLWSESVWMETRQQRKSKAVDALKKTNNDPRVIIVTARMFWTERNIPKARSWFEKAVAVNPDLGKSFGALLRLNLCSCRRLVGMVAPL